MFRIAMLRLWVAASIVFLVALTAAPAAARTWTDQRGRTISGKFVRVDGDKVVILSGGKVVSPRLASLSQADQNYVRDVLAGKQPADDSPGKAGAESPGEAGGGLDLQTEETGDSDGEADNDGQTSSIDPFHSSSDKDDEASDDSSPGAGEEDSDDDSSPGAKRSSSGLPVKTTAVLRNWSTAKGPVRGTFVRYYDGNVIIKRGAKVEQHSFWTLGDGDQQYVRDLLAARGTPDAIPDSPPASLATEGASSQDGAPIGAAGMPGMAGAGRGFPMGMGARPGMGGPPGMRGPGAMGAMPGSMPGGMPGATPGMGQIPGMGGALGGPPGASPPGAIAGMPGGMLGGMPGTPNGAMGGMPSGMPSAGIGPRFGPSGLDPSGMGPTGIGPRMGTGLGGGMGAQPGGPTFARNETPLPTLAPPPEITMPKQFVTPARPFAGREEPPPEAVAVGVMIIVLSIACPAILFIAFVGFLIWLIVKMTSRPSYPQTY